MSRSKPRVAVVGAGLAGLGAARRLSQEGVEITVFDKGRGPGGRSSLRRRDGFEFDHGAQYFTARDPRFQQAVDDWIERGVVAQWQPRLRVFEKDQVTTPDSTTRRYVGVPGMNALARPLAEGIDVRCSTRVDQIERCPRAAGQGWALADDQGHDLGEFDAVVLTPPPAQAAQLLQAAPELANRVDEAQMIPTWAVLVGFASPAKVDFDAAFVNHGPIGWIARNSSKPGRDGGDAWVVHASEAWSIANLEKGPSEVAEPLSRELEILFDLAGSQPMPAVASIHAHLWRYARPKDDLDLGCLFDPALRLGVAGDWCTGGRVEGAFTSGVSCAEALLDTAS